jgi:flagellar basal-body rod protein FlgC
MGFDITDVIANSMSAQRLRVNLAASNIANAETTRTAEGGPYRRRDLVQAAQTVPPTTFGSILDEMSLAKPVIVGVVQDNSPPRMVHQPGHPDANQEGYVAYPNINPVTTMVDLTNAARLYQAGATVLQTVSQMSQDARNISRG